MRKGSYLINVARGAVVVESALVDALASGRLAGAGLDVTEVEPLDATSKLWDDPKVIITPHVSGITDDYRERVGELICQNVDHFSAGETLLNIVDPEKRY